MPKQILPFELAEIVTGLLVKPELLGELDSPERHFSFIQSIAQVVADHCGGSVNGVNPPTDGPVDVHNPPLASIHPNDSLPSLASCVWAPYDPRGWEDFSDEDLGLAGGFVPLSTDEISTLRTRIRNLLNEAYALDLEQRL